MKQFNVLSKSEALGKAFVDELVIIGYKTVARPGVEVNYNNIILNSHPDVFIDNRKIPEIHVTRENRFISSPEPDAFNLPEQWDEALEYAKEVFKYCTEVKKVYLVFKAGSWVMDTAGEIYHIRKGNTPTKEVVETSCNRTLSVTNLHIASKNELLKYCIKLAKSRDIVVGSTVTGMGICDLKITMFVKVEQEVNRLKLFVNDNYYVLCLNNDKTIKACSAKNSLYKFESGEMYVNNVTATSLTFVENGSLHIFRISKIVAIYEALSKGFGSYEIDFVMKIGCQGITFTDIKECYKLIKKYEKK